MAEVNELAGVPSPRRQLNLFYLIDTSYSMEGQKIESINQVMPEVINMVADISENNQDNAKIMVSCMSFNTTSEWMYDKPVEATNFNWTPLTVTGCTQVGEVCKKLEAALHRGSKDNPGVMFSETGHKNPCIIILSDGEPTDNWKTEFDKLKHNAWFKAATKLAIAIGNDADTNMLAEFVGNKELVIGVHNIQGLKKMISTASCSVSRVGSQSAGTSTSNSSDQILQDIKKEADKDNTIVVNPTDPTNKPADNWDDFD